MYKVYRWMNDMPQELLATCDTFREAYDWARSAATREHKRAKAIRILGPSPSNLRAGRYSKSASSDMAQRQFWYVLNGVLPTKGAILASAVLQRINGEGDGAGAPEPRESPQTKAKQSTQVAHAKTSAPVSQPSKKRFHVVRDSPQELITVGGEFTTRAEAQAYIAMRRQHEHDPAATYRVEAGPPDIRKNRRRRATQPARTTQEHSGRRERIYQKREGKRDLSLLARPEEELGLGIPAQWGKGRNSRKGDYIP